MRYVCTPSGMHEDIVLAAAETRKHVLCEKPLEIRAERMTAMIQACHRAGVKLGAVYQRRALPLAEQVKRAIDRGELAKLVLCDASLKYYRHQAYYDSAGWRGTWAMDGGRLNEPGRPWRRHDSMAGWRGRVRIWESSGARSFH